MHPTHREALIHELLGEARRIAIVGASPHAHRHSRQVFAYLDEQGYEVIPVRPDLAAVDGKPARAHLEDIPEPVDIVVIFRRREFAPAVIDAAARKAARAVWLPPGVTSLAAEDRARRHGLVLVKDRCIEEEHRKMPRAPRRVRMGAQVRRFPLQRRRHKPV